MSTILHPARPRNTVSDRSPDEVAESITFAQALSATSRQTVTAQKVPPLALHDPVLVELAQEALGGALGPALTGSEPFRMTVWQHGSSHVGKPMWILGGNVVPEGTPDAIRRVSPGVTFNGTVADFVEILRRRAQAVAAKKTGWVVEPTTTKSGQRTNDDTLSMHAVFLDCDNHGDWDQTLAALTALGLAHVAYRSSGHEPEAPKWRVVLPLAAPFSVQSDVERRAWKQIYHRCRVVVGALGGLAEEGFDPRTDGPSIPWFLTERRTSVDPQREVRFAPGASLDLIALAMSLPMVEEAAEEKHVRPVGVATEREALLDAEIDEAVAALAAVTKSVPRGRRDLFLSLPGAMLDRGVMPEDVITICTEVSLAYPRKHAEKHADNVHNARTTVAKFLAKDDTYTRIGTLQAAFPEVAAVIDRLFPDLVDAAIAAAVSAGIVDQTAAVDPSYPVPPPWPPQVSPQLPSSAAAKVRAQLETLAATSSRSKDPRHSSAAAILAHVMSGRRLDQIWASRIYPDAVEQAAHDGRIRLKATKSLFGLIGFELGVDSKKATKVTFGEVFMALNLFGLPVDLHNAAAREFAAAVDRRRAFRAKLNTSRAAERRAKDELSLRACRAEGGEK